jgi:SAM-dependent methyltransferase
MLGSILKDLIRTGKAGVAAESGRRRVLNVGGGSKAIPIPSHYDGWDHVLLDIDRRRNADLIFDARQLGALPATQFDAVYCSHNLEHYYRHDGAKVLQGFLHVLKPDGYAEITVPDIQAVMQKVVQSGMDIGDVLYPSALGPITAHDVLYGFGKEIEESGQDFFAHKTGFTPKLLHGALERAGFAAIFVIVTPDLFEVRAFAFKARPTAEQQRVLNLPAS